MRPTRSTVSEGIVVDAFSTEVVVGRARYVNKSTGFAVFTAAAGQDRLALVGPIAHLEEGERVAVVGEWVDDPRFGRQLRVAEARPLPPADSEALIAYLRRVRHVGAKRAEALIDRFGDDVLSEIDDDPPAAFAAVGLSRGRAAEAGKSWDALRGFRELHLLLAPHGLAYLAVRVHRYYGDEAHRVIRERPYALTAVFGVGFRIADRIARGLGEPPDSPERAAAAVLHCLSEAEQSGSTCLPLPVARSQAARLLETEPPDVVLLERMAEEERLVLVEDDPAEPPWVYRPSVERLEAELAERVVELARSTPSSQLRVPESSIVSAGGQAIQLVEEQWQGVRAAFTSRLSVITGGPGTGKTATIRAVGAVALRQGLRVLLVAPTGRAAKRMAEATGLQAATIHSALGWIPGQGPLHDSHDPVPCDLLVVDESSMASLEVLVTLLRAVGRRTHVLLVGDADQLAPVGAGKPFAEILASDLVPATRLQHIFRQAAGSMIVRAAHAVREGRTPSFEADGGMSRDLFLIERENPIDAREEIVRLVAERLPGHYGIDRLADIQVFAPVYRGELGIAKLNTVLREAINPDGEPACAGRLRIGDKVILSGRNLHDRGLMNGTLLRLVAERQDDEGLGDRVVVEADDSVYELTGEDSAALQPAYACSVHKGQGIELPIAVVVAHPAAGRMFFRREMLYTAITRATRATVIVGTRDAVARAIATTDTGRRYSRLIPRLRCNLRNVQGG